MGQPRNSCWFSYLVLSITIVAGCDEYRSTQFQQSWKGDILRAKEAVLRFAEENGTLPNNLDETDRRDIGALVQYQALSADEFLVWIIATDIVRITDNPGGFSPTEKPPGSDDVFGRYMIDGQLLESSWK